MYEQPNFEAFNSSLKDTRNMLMEVVRIELTLSIPH